MAATASRMEARGRTGLEVASKLEVATMWTMSNLEVLIFLAVVFAITGTVMLTLR